jgi:hypothetical protein
VNTFFNGHRVKLEDDHNKRMDLPTFNVCMKQLLGDNKLIDALDAEVRMNLTEIDRQALSDRFSLGNQSETKTEFLAEGRSKSKAKKIDQ